GIGRSLLSVINLVFIVKLDNLSNYNYICRTSFIPTEYRLSKDKIAAIALQSPVNSAVFWAGHWSPMQILVA
ncbi:hypothetical protein WDZ92_50730, partial [Nostoc sp. NIES-2111]